MRATALPALVLLPAASAAQDFVERAADYGLHHEFVAGFDRVGAIELHEYAQAGIALGDLDGDGDLEVLACGGVGTNTLLFNAGGAFVDVTQFTGLEVGELDRAPAIGDYDADGDLDVFIGSMERGGGATQGRGRLYRNEGGSFREVTPISGTTGNGRSLYARWDDLDRDGLLDLYVCEFLGTPNVWYRNNGDGGFTEMAAELGIAHGGSTHVAGVIDADGDRRPDLFVCNDAPVSLWGGLDYALDAIFHGNAAKTFDDVSELSGLDTKGGLMGISFADVNYDGRLDAYKTDVDSNWLFINEGWPGSGQAWTDQAAAYGVVNGTYPCEGCPTGTAKLVGWACPFLHADKDPWVDLLVVNGQVPGIVPTATFSQPNQPNALYMSEGPDHGFHFTDRAVAAGLTEELVDDRACAVSDLDRDGDLDLLIGPINGPLRYYENQLDPADGHWIAVEVTCLTSARGGVGVEVRWTDELGYPHLTTIGGDAPTASQDELRAWFGLGDEDVIDLFVRFPSGVEIAVPQAAADQVLNVTEPRLIRVSQRTLPIDGAPLVVTAFAHGADGAPLDETAEVSIEVPGLSPSGPVLAMGENEFQRTFDPPSAPGSYRVQVAFDDFAVLIEPQVHAFDPADASGTEVTAIPEAVRAGSADTLDLWVVPKSADGLLLGPGRDVVLEVSGLGAVTDPKDLGDGSYVFHLLAPPQAWTVPVDVLVDGGWAASIELRAAGAADLGMTEVYWELPLIDQSPSQDRARLAVRPRDAQGRALGPNAAVELALHPDVGSALVSLLPGLPAQGRRDGEFFFVLEKPPGASPGAATGVVEVIVDGVTLGGISYGF